ncbi:MAG: hypothetical protein WBB01_20795 [Phormidesmis sp.]
MASSEGACAAYYSFRHAAQDFSLSGNHS